MIAMWQTPVLCVTLNNQFFHTCLGKILGAMGRFWILYGTALGLPHSESLCGISFPSLSCPHSEYDSLKYTIKNPLKPRFYYVQI